MTFEINQNTSEMRDEASYSINDTLLQMNSSMSGDPLLVELVLRGEQDIESLNPVEKEQFAHYEFSRLNLCEYILRLEDEGLSDVHIKYVEHIVRQFNRRPGLSKWIASVDDYAGTDEFYSRLTAAPR